MKTTHRFLAVMASAFVLQACDSDSVTAVTPPPPAAPAMASFDVTVTNLTNAQPLSPIAVIGHNVDYSLFAVGAPATLELEELSEGGSNASLINAADNNVNVYDAVSGGAPIGPAGAETVNFEVDLFNLGRTRFSTVTMLVNTNDAFSAVNNIDVSGLNIGDSMSFDAIAYDAGTELDTEAAGDIPGPAGGGEGFNAARDDEADRVSMHSGVVSQNDGLATSGLTEQHRFDNPVMRVRIVRIQ